MTPSASQPIPESIAILVRLLRTLAMTEERELSCEEVFELVDYYAELQGTGVNAQDLLPAVAHHLRLCPECADEYRALMRCLEMETSASGQAKSGGKV